MGQSDAIRDLLEPALTSEGLELWDVEVSRQAVRVSVDRPGGIDLDALAAIANRVVSPLLEDHPELTPDTRFSLEVSSPGMERPLRTVDQYRRYLGTEVSIKTRVPVGGSRRHTGVLLAADDVEVRIRPSDPAEVTEMDLPLAEIERAKTVVDWGPSRQSRPQGGSAQGPGHTRKNSQARSRSREAGRSLEAEAAHSSVNDSKDEAKDGRA
jgi:ribosome maturation factor RimP